MTLVCSACLKRFQLSSRGQLARWVKRHLAERNAGMFTCAKRSTASHDNRARMMNSQSPVRTETPVYVSGPSHHKGAGLGESWLDSTQAFPISRSRDA